MDAEVTSQKLLDFVLSVSEHMGVIASPVERSVLLDKFVVLVFVPVDKGSDRGDFSQQVQRILIEVLPVRCLGHFSLIIQLREDRVLLEVKQTL
jgi:hypothetical protein